MRRQGEARGSRKSGMPCLMRQKRVGIGWWTRMLRKFEFDVHYICY